MPVYQGDELALHEFFKTDMISVTKFEKSFVKQPRILV